MTGVADVSLVYELPPEHRELRELVRRIASERVALRAAEIDRLVIARHVVAAG